MFLSTEHGRLEPFLHPRHLISLSDPTAHEIFTAIFQLFVHPLCHFHLTQAHFFYLCFPCPSLLLLVTKLWIQEARSGFLSQTPQYWPSKGSCSSSSPPSHSRSPVYTACRCSVMASSKSFFSSLTVPCPSASVPFLRLSSMHLSQVQLKHLWENVYIDTALIYDSFFYIAADLLKSLYNLFWNANTENWHLRGNAININKTWFHSDGLPYH